MLVKIFSMSALCISLWLPVQESGSRDAPGMILGTVKTSDGKAAAGFQVLVMGVSAGSSSTSRVSVSDEGEYEVQDLQNGEYVIEPFQEGETSRYLGGFSSFYSPHPARVQISSAQPVQKVDLRLGPPNRIVSGTVTSSATGTPIVASVLIEYPGDSDRFIRFSTARDGSYRALIPGETLLDITIKSPGFTTLKANIQPVAVDKDVQLNYRLNKISQ